NSRRRPCSSGLSLERPRRHAGPARASRSMRHGRWAACTLILPSILVLLAACGGALDHHANDAGADQKPRPDEVRKLLAVRPDEVPDSFPKLLFKFPPTYPQKLQGTKLESSVGLKVIVRASGDVDDLIAMTCAVNRRGESAN